MINITIKTINNKFNSLNCKGHANSDEYGKDLVCAAVSAVITGGFNNLKDTSSLKLVLEEGYASLEVITELSKHDEVVVETIITGLQTIKESNPKCIKITNL